MYVKGIPCAVIKPDIQYQAVLTHWPNGKTILHHGTWSTLVSVNGLSSNSAKLLPESSVEEQVFIASHITTEGKFTEVISVQIK